jgi:hypothetical protein
MVLWNASLPLLRVDQWFLTARKLEANMPAMVPNRIKANQIDLIGNLPPDEMNILLMTFFLTRNLNALLG